MIVVGLPIGVENVWGKTYVQCLWVFYATTAINLDKSYNNTNRNKSKKKWKNVGSSVVTGRQKILVREEAINVHTNARTNMQLHILTYYTPDT